MICLQKACISLLVLACPNETNVHPAQAELLCRYVYAIYHVDGLVQERRNCNALAMELRLSCTNPSKYAQLYYLRPVLAFGYCRCLCVCVSVNHKLVHVIINQPLKLESPNLDQRCKRPWLRSLLFLGQLTLNFKVKLNLKSQNLLHFQLVHVISHHQLKSVFPNFDQKYILALLRSLLILGWIDPDVQFRF